MSEQVYAIAKWHETFETNESRKYKSLPWISLPTSVESNGYQDLCDDFGDEAPAIYGAWCALCKAASKAPARGILANSRGAAWSIERIARMCHFPVAPFEKLIPWAASERVGWLEVMEPSEVGREIAGRSPGDEHGDTTATERNVTEHNVTEPDGRNVTQGPPEIASQEDLGKRRVATAELARQVIETVAGRGERLTQRNRELAYKAAAFEFDPALNGYLPKLLEKLQSKIRGPDPPRKPWGYLKSEMLRLCRDRGVEFDKLWDSIEVPPKSKPAEVKQ